MAHGISGIEHIALAVSDLDRTAELLRRLGFTVAAPDPVGSEAISGVSLLFRDGRIEFRDAAAGGRMEAGLLTASLDDCRAALQAKGWRLREEPASALVSAGGTGAGSRLVLEGAAPTAGIDFRVCPPATIPPARFGEWTTHANGARALGVVTAVADDPQSLAPWAESLFGESAVVLTDDTLAVFPGHNGFLFVTSDHLGVLFPEFDAGDIAPGRVAAVSVVVDDIRRTEAVLAKADMAFAKGDADGVLHVPHSPDLPLLLEFTTRDRFGSVRSFFD